MLAVPALVGEGVGIRLELVCEGAGAAPPTVAAEGSEIVHRIVVPVPSVAVW